jgi:ribokinase
MKPYDLIGCGALNLDLIYRLPESFALWSELGPPGSEMVMTAKQRQTLRQALLHVEPERSGGGQAANTVFALARMGFGAAMLGRTGDDADGEFVLAELDGADTHYVARSGETGCVHVLLDQAGERRNLVWPGANDEFSPQDLPHRLPRARFAYFSSFVGEGPLEAQLALLQRLDSDVEVAFDPGELYARKGVKRFIPFLQRCSYLFATQTELELMCGITADEALDFLLNVGVGLVVCKMGGRGARLIGRRVDLYVPPQPTEVVDVTGAGDLFAAGFLAGMMEQAGLQSAGRLGAWAAARGVAGVGRTSYPDAAAWQERLSEERALQ